MKGKVPVPKQGLPESMEIIGLGLLNIDSFRGGKKLIGIRENLGRTRSQREQSS